MLTFRGILTTSEYKVKSYHSGFQCNSKEWQLYENCTAIVEVQCCTNSLKDNSAVFVMKSGDSQVIYLFQTHVQCRDQEVCMLRVKAVC